jgi:FkbM family methyltransferase
MISIERFKLVAFEFQNFIFRFLLKKSLLVRNAEPMVFLGNSYSGYWFPKDLVQSHGTIWGVGLGHDSSFELELTKLGFDFIGFEPEFECFVASKKQFSHTNAVIENYGLWDKTGKFNYTGTNISIVNIFNLKEKSKEFLDIRSLWDESRLKDITHQPKPRILKLNIEGAEREILLKFIEEPLDFDVIIFQAEFLFHLGFKRVGKKILASRDLVRILRDFQSKGWRIAHFSRHQITLLQDIQQYNLSGDN